MVGKPLGLDSLGAVLAISLAVNRYPNSLLFLNPLLKGDLETDKKLEPKRAKTE